MAGYTLPLCDWVSFSCTWHLKDWTNWLNWPDFLIMSCMSPYTYFSSIWLSYDSINSGCISLLSYTLHTTFHSFSLTGSTLAVCGSGLRAEWGCLSLLSDCATSDFESDWDNLSYIRLRTDLLSLNVNVSGSSEKALADCGARSKSRYYARFHALYHLSISAEVALHGFKINILFTDLRLAALKIPFGALVLSTPEASIIVVIISQLVSSYLKLKMIKFGWIFWAPKSDPSRSRAFNTHCPCLVSTADISALSLFVKLVQA